VSQGEGSEGGRESVELDEGEPVVAPEGVHVQTLDAVKGTNPATNIWILERGGVFLTKEECACVVSEGVGRIGEDQLPRFDGTFGVVEPDASEEVSSSSWDP